MTHSIDVNLAGAKHRILIGTGLLERVGVETAAVARHEKALLAVDANIASDHGPAARFSLESAGYEVTVCELIAEEGRKVLATVHAVYDAMLAARLERGSPVVALGGGVVGDVAGYAAATFLRGVPVVQVPTTLLAMVDASIGGKTGVNFPLPVSVGGTRGAEHGAEPGDRPLLGKNLIGAFWQPRIVLADPVVLETLAPRDLRCGLAECAKHALIADPDLIDMLESRAERIAALDLDALEALITRSAGIKVAIVEEDVREAGRRALLNLGHTFAHAIEPIARQDLRHGEAVSIGLCAAAWCSVATGRLEAADAQRIVALLERLDLPVRLRRPEPVPALLEAMRYDKKVAGGRIRLVLPRAIGRAEIVEDAPPEAIASAWEAVGGVASGGMAGGGVAGRS